MKTFDTMGTFDLKLTMVFYEYILGVQLQIALH